MSLGLRREDGSWACRRGVRSGRGCCPGLALCAAGARGGPGERCQCDVWSGGAAAAPGCERFSPALGSPAHPPAEAAPAPGPGVSPRSPRPRHWGCAVGAPRPAPPPRDRSSPCPAAPLVASDAARAWPGRAEAVGVSQGWRGFVTVPSPAVPGGVRGGLGQKLSVSVWSELRAPRAAGRDARLML